MTEGGDGKKKEIGAKYTAFYMLDGQKKDCSVIVDKQISGRRFYSLHFFLISL